MVCLFVCLLTFPKNYSLSLLWFSKKLVLFLVGKVDDSGELTEKEIIRAERNAGFISSRLREIQVRFLLKASLKVLLFMLLLHQNNVL